MIIHLVRHAHAGNRSAWVGDDAVRPLSDKGRAQSDAIAEAISEAIADALAHDPADRAPADRGKGSIELWSSPFVRCIQTLEPLGARLDLKVRSVDELAEGVGGAASLDALLTAADRAAVVVACSHGDVIPAIVATALDRGATLDGDREPRKAARYVVRVTDGAITHLAHVPRPEV